MRITDGWRKPSMEREWSDRVDDKASAFEADVDRRAYVPGRCAGTRYYFQSTEVSYDFPMSGCNFLPVHTTIITFATKPF